MRGIHLVHLLSLTAVLRTGFSIQTSRKNLIIDTDIFSDVEYAPSFLSLLMMRQGTEISTSDTAALLLSATSAHVNLLAVNVNYPSTYSALATSAILSHYGQGMVPIGVKRPLTNDSFFDDYTFELGEYASKIAYHHSGGSLPWGTAENAAEPVSLYRRILSEAADNSVTIASIGFLDNVSRHCNALSCAGSSN